jgi:hypothetical protein
MEFFTPGYFNQPQDLLITFKVLLLQSDEPHAAELQSVIGEGLNQKIYDSCTIKTEGPKYEITGSSSMLSRSNSSSFDFIHSNIFAMSGNH